MENENPSKAKSDLEKPGGGTSLSPLLIHDAMAELWAGAVNREGGDVTVVHLPEKGICGNTHFPFSDLNNIEIADLVSKFLRQKGLD